MKQFKNNLLPSLDIQVPREVEIHYKRPLFSSMITISNSEDATRCLRKCINLDKIDHKEFFWILLLNNANKLLGFAEIGKGSDMGVTINYKEIFQLLLLTNSKAFIVAHNHPSGKLTSSISDKKATEKLKEMVELFSICFLDHIIITSESHYSFFDSNCL